MNGQIKLKAAKLYQQNAAVLTMVFLTVNMLFIVKFILVPDDIQAALPLRLLYILTQRSLTTYFSMFCAIGIAKCLYSIVETGRAEYKDLLFAFSDKRIFKKAALLILVLYLPIELIEEVLRSGGLIYALVSGAVVLISAVYLFLTAYYFVADPFVKTIDVIKNSVEKMRGQVLRLISLAACYIGWILLAACLMLVCSLAVMLFMQNFSNPPDVNFVVIAYYLLGIFFMPYLQLPLAILAKRILDASERAEESAALPE